MNSTNHILDFSNSEEVANLAKKFEDVNEITQRRLLHIENLLIDINFTLGRILLSQMNNDTKF